MIRIPQKSHFKTDEVCGLTGIKPYVLRFWETEFSQIHPITSSSGQKLYSYDDVEKILFIKKILFEDKKTIEQAKRDLLLLCAQVEPIEKTCENNDQIVDASLDLEKLVLAKQHLQSVLELTESLKHKHNWL